MNTPTIEIQHLEKRFGSVIALDDVTLNANAGELFFLLGPSGCGKTTLLRILAGLETADRGTILLRGRDVSGLPPYRRGAPMVFQNYALWPHLNVRDNIAFGLVEQKVKRAEIEARVNRTLEQVGLAGLGARLPGQLSGGQQQRVVLARALVLNPDVILLDEPLSNLDAKLRHDMREEIARLHRETAITFVYVTHDQSEALSLADRMAVMRNGRLCAVGKPFDLYHRPPNVFCADFLGESNLIPATVKTVTGPDRVMLDTPLGSLQAVWTRDSRPAPGDRLTCMIRPEHLRPAASSAPDANRFHAAVADFRMNGPTVSVRLDAAGHALKATLTNDFMLSLQRGQTGDWAAEINHTIALPDTP